MLLTGANYTGTQLEKFIHDRLIEKGYAFIPRDRFEAAAYIEQPIFTRQLFVGKSIYETDMYCDFMVYHPVKHPQCLIIESKWQQSGGSVDEKFPYFVLNIQHKYPKRTVVVLAGGGYKKQAETWLRKQVGNNLLHVFNMEEFQRWANKGGI